MAGPKTASSKGQVRIIGGSWRGRKLDFTVTDGLRPTPNRVRETLFNWLAPVISGARCLDLFAGSGSLGLEALSRGADSCDFVDRNRQSVAEIERHVAALGAADRGRCHTGNAESFLRQASTSYNVVFIDPPFASDLAQVVCLSLRDNRLLSGEAYVYLETAADAAPPDVPEHWEIYRSKRAAGVAYRVYLANALNGTG